MSYYRKLIEARLEAWEILGEYDPRHIEGWMRIEHGTLDHLGFKRFTEEVKIGIHLIRLEGIEEAESLARSYGL